MLTFERLKELLHYDPETGEWRWLTPINKRAKIGDAVGTISVHGYRIITIAGVKYRSSRLAYLYVKGSWPPDEMDHEDRCKLNDRWNNLRVVSRSENALNRDLQSNNFSGARGVHWDNKASKWVAQVKSNGLTHWVGGFDSFDDAVAARDAAATKHHQNFAVLNGKAS